MLAYALIAIPQAPVSLEEAERIAVAHSTDVRVAQNSLKSAWARAGQVASKTRPQLGLSGSASRFDDKTTVSLGGASIQMMSDHTEDVALQLVQVLDVTNQIGTAYAQAKLGALAEEYSVKAHISDQILNTKTTYLNVLRAAQGVKVAESSLEAYRQQLKTTTALYKQGVGQKIDVHRATSQVATAEKDLVQRQNDLNMARSTLNDQLGLPLDSDTQLIDPPHTDLPNMTVRDSLFALASDRRAEMKSASLGVKAAEKGIKLARSTTDPTVTLALAGNYYPTTSFSSPRQSTGTLTLSVNIPIYDGGEARARVEDARASLDTAKAQEQQVKRAVFLQVQNAALDVESARKTLSATESALKAAVAARDLASQRYEGQVGLYLEVTDSQAALSAAQAARVNAAYDLMIAEARLERALGDLPVPTQSTTPSGESH